MTEADILHASICRRIKAARKQRKWSAQKLAKLAHCSEQTVYLCEQGENVGSRTFFRMVQILGVLQDGEVPPTADRNAEKPERVPVKMRRVWAMPNHETFSVPPIAEALQEHLSGCAVVVDPFARNSTIATHRNDLDMATSADSHLPADVFCERLAADGVVADAVLFDPPYSPRQVAEMYRGIGLPVTREDTQTARLYKRVRDRLDAILRPGGIAISFGWNSNGFGVKRKYTPVELVVVAHGAAHNDTLVLVERKAVERAQPPQDVLSDGADFRGLAGRRSRARLDGATTMEGFRFPFRNLSRRADSA